jgi:hypothetical protein
MGQRFIQLNSTWTGYSNNKTATLHVSQLPPNSAIFAPGPALLFVVVNDVPSVGVLVMVGSGQLGPQEVLPVAQLPPSSILQLQSSAQSNLTNSSRHSGASRTRAEASQRWFTVLWILGTLFFLCLG